MNDSLLISIREIPIPDIKKYLEWTKWIHDGDVWGNSSIWHKETIEDAEIILPTSKDLKDYDRSVMNLIKELSRVEVQPIATIVKNIINASNDQISIRIAHHDVNEGSIPLEDGVLLHEKIRDMMSSVALSTISREKYFSGPRPPEALNYLNEIRFGLSEKGSYIVNVLAPVEVPRHHQDEFETTSFSRLVTETLSKSLKALNQAINGYQRNNEVEAFNSMIQDGVSANLCDALIGLSGQNRNRNFEISLNTSKAVEYQNDLNNTFAFKNSDTEILERASNFFKDNYVIPDTTIFGIIKKLSRASNQEKGEVTISIEIGESTKSVTFELNPNDYVEAIHAHEGKVYVSCSGDLHVAPRSARLLNNYDFIVHSNSELF